MSRNYDAVLFDFGGVFTPSPFDAVESADDEIDLLPDRLFSLVFGPYDQDSDHPWHRLERGEIAIGESRDAIMESARESGHEFDPIQLLIRVGGGAPRQDLIDRVAALRAEGYATALVTNNVVEFREHWRKLISVDALFDAVIDSSEVGTRKPDPAIYHLALEKLGNVAAERAVFLDDYVGNIDAATALGHSGVLMTADVTQAIAELGRLLSPAAR